jgi:hypothetical protein
MPPPTRHPILGRGCRSMRLLPIFFRHQSRHRLAQWLLHVHEDVSHHARTIIFAVIGRPVRLPGLRPVLPPQPTAPAHGCSREPTDARRRLRPIPQSWLYCYPGWSLHEQVLTERYSGKRPEPLRYHKIIHIIRITVSYHKCSHHVH